MKQYRQTAYFLILFGFIATFAPTLGAQNWNQIIKSAASDRAASDNFGWSVAISGDYAVVSAVGDDKDATGGNPLNNAGSAYIFKRTGTNWVQEAKIVASDRAADDSFGYSVGISGDYVIVGAFQEDENATGGSTLTAAGSAYIFKRTGTTWAQEAKIVAADRGQGDWFGLSVAINGDYAIVGAYAEDHDATGGNFLNNSGSAYIFKRTGTTWAQEAKIVAADRGAGDFFSASVAINGDYAVVGAILEAEDATGGNTLLNAGSAYIFKRTGTTWAQEAKIVAADRGASDEFGRSVGISGDYVVVGSNLEDEDAAGGTTLNSAGSAYIFKRTGTTWAQEAKIVAADRGADDQFAWSVGISGDFVIVGSHFEDPIATTGSGTVNNAGSAYIFKRTGTTWAQQAKIAASDRATNDFFGRAVAISGDFAISGAYLESEDATGGNTLSGAGSAYFFKPSPVWTGAASTDWANAANWQPTYAPAPVENVTIPTTTNAPTLLAAQTVASMTLTGTNKVILGNNNLTVGALTGGSSANYVVTNGTGSLTVNNIGTTATLVPVGPSITQYAPVTITNNVSRNFSVKVGNTVTNPVFGYRYINHQWDVTPSVLTGNLATLAFGWSASAQSANFNIAQPVRILILNTTTNTWDAAFNAAVAGTNPYTATASGINFFSPFSVCNYTGVAVQTISEKDKLKVYPNPVSHQLTIENAPSGLGAGDYHIFNLLGQEILRGPATAQRIDVSALPEGSYVLKVAEEQVKFIKQ